MNTKVIVGGGRDMVAAHHCATIPPQASIARSTTVLDPRGVVCSMGGRSAAAGALVSEWASLHNLSWRLFSRDAVAQHVDGRDRCVFTAQQLPA